MKHCSKCNQEKPLESFYLKKDSKYQPWCKQCHSEYYKRYFIKNKIKLSIKEKKYRMNSKEVRKEYQRRNQEKIKQRRKLYYLKNKEKFKAIDKIYKRHRKLTNPLARLTILLRDRINKAVRKQFTKKAKHTIELLGLPSFQEFKPYFENKFSSGMTWEKFMNGEIHIDHIKPCASFDLSDPTQQKQCFHYTNLQPLWATTEVARKNGDFISIGNIEKGNR